MRTIMSAFKGSLEPNTSLGGFPDVYYYNLFVNIVDRESEETKKVVTWEKAAFIQLIEVPVQDLQIIMALVQVRGHCPKVTGS
uniref:Uncharacterized protein n=1 Tax=Helianthus annuus TaxID=4232 RepID=A0A251VNH2_HELAN